jgi:hypothetical protein
MAKQLEFIIGGKIFLVDDINLDNIYLETKNPETPTEQNSSNLYGLTDQDYEMIVQEVDTFVHNPLINNDTLYLSFIFGLLRRNIYIPKRENNQEDSEILFKLVTLYNFAINKWRYIYYTQPHLFNNEMAKLQINKVFTVLYNELTNK